MNHATIRAARTAFATLALALGAALGMALPAHAHGDNHSHEPQHGGMVTEVGDIDYELVLRPDVATLYVRDHGRSANTEGASARLTLLSGSTKTEASLTPAGAGMLQAKGSFPVAAGTKAVVLVNLPGRKAANMRFAVK